MRLLSATLASLAAVLLFPAAASAQNRSLDDSIRGMHLYGWCVVIGSPSQSRQVLGHAPGSAAERNLLREIASDRCTNGQGALEELLFQPQMLRGAIAEQIFHDDVVRLGARPRRTLVAPFTGLTAEEIAALSDSGRSSLRALDFAQCVMTAAPDGVVALLGTRPTTRAEERAFQQLSAHFGPCLPQGAQMTIAKPQLRGFLAEAAYRHAYAAARQPQ